MIELKNCWIEVKQQSLTHSNVLRSPPWLGWLLWNICVTNDHGYVPLVVETSQSFLRSWLITGFITRLTRRRVPLPTLPEHMSSPPVFSGVRVTRSWVLCVCYVDRFFPFFFWPLCCLLRHTGCDDPFDIFKLFLANRSEKQT